VDEAVQPAEVSKPKIWGPVSGIFLGLSIFIAAQIITAIILGILAEVSGVSVTEYFGQNPVLVSFVGAVLFGSMTVGLVHWATKDYGFWTSLKLTKPKLESLVWVFPALVGYVILSGMLYALVSVLFPETNLDQEQVLGFENATSFGQQIIAFIALVVIAPIAEEILFRGYTFQGVRRKFSWPVAAVVSAGLFGLAHMQLNVGIDTFALGFVACVLLEKTGSLWPAILLHAIKNSIAFYILFVAS